MFLCKCIRRCYNNNKLRHVDKTVPLFTLDKKIYRAKVVDVYDGDTIKVVILFHGTPTKFSVRMSGYDSPELRTKNLEEKSAAIKARDFLKSKIDDKIVELHCGKFDKYGRLLGTIFYNDQNINELMIQTNHGYRYHGKTKIKFKTNQICVF